MEPKLHIFLTLCQTMNYRLAAELLRKVGEPYSELKPKKE